MFKPLNGRVLVRPDPGEKETVSGILLPEDKKKPVTGVALTGEFESKRVLFSVYGYDEVSIEGKMHYVVSEASLLGVFE